MRPQSPIPELLSGWGRYPVAPCRIDRPRDAAALRAILARDGPALIARGMGRSYGDSAINPGGVIDMRRLDHMLDFDAARGVLTVEAGVVLGDVIAAFLPRGWFPPVTPGTKFVTIGGMIAADVHGKNHHRDGSFGNFVEWIDLMGADGQLTRCSRAENPALFAHTVGGMGLTGIILRAAFRLRRVQSAWIRQETIPCGNLDAVMRAFERAQAATYSVAWIDCLATGSDLGRSILMLGEHAGRGEVPDGSRPFETPHRARRRVPLDAPSWALNRLSVRAFNALYYRQGARRAGLSIVDWDSYFYPLDAILEWNRIYGRPGFAQFQCVLPPERARAGLTALLQAISGAGKGSFLAVLKRLGPQESAFSFPMDGYTLALDFPVNAAVLALLETLDGITLAHGGRFYLAKDARMRAGTQARADARTAAMTSFRDTHRMRTRFASQQSTRLGL
ncbi:FAD-dependent oxidoreductase [Sedimentitalea sp. XS_ASV28]|uniref:FAD-binding oxidoreductase n=1 Tax=Sedimentitalea sp. XS_ASV28 TaxID=3241296 RepID=UPI0035148AF7